MLSDITIRQYIARNLLVPNGDPAKATQAAYHFSAGKVFTGGKDCQVLDWGIPQPTDHYKIAPGAMVWVRMREAVSLPDDICAVWWQTHSLSKRGIMLINMSIVDPGYVGHLTCLLVNFGNQHVAITPDTTVAKLAFFRTDQAVNLPFSGTATQATYDADVLQTATNGPTSFLQLDNLSTELGAKKAAILQEIAEDAPKKLLKTYTYAVLGLLALILATSTIPWIQSLVKPNLENAVQDAIDKRVSGQLSMMPSEREKALSLRVEKLERALAAKQQGSQATPKKATQVVP